MTVAFDREQYENQAYWDGYAVDPAEPARVAAIRAMIPDDVAAILDVGCGIGSLTNTLDAPLVVGVDLALTPLRSVTKDRVQASITALPFKPKTFDLVIVTEVLEHLDEASLVAAVAEIHRLGPKYLLVSTPDREDLLAEQVRCADCGHVFNPYHHRWSFDLHALYWLIGLYFPVKVAGATPLPTPNRRLNRLKRACRVYDASSAPYVCDHCGGRSGCAYDLQYYLFGAVGRTLYHAKRLLGITAPYHQIVLFRLFGGFYGVFVHTRRDREERDRWRRLHDAAFERFIEQARRERA